MRMFSYKQFYTRTVHDDSTKYLETPRPQKCAIFGNKVSAALRVARNGRRSRDFCLSRLRLYIRFGIVLPVSRGIKISFSSLNRSYTKQGDIRLKISRSIFDHDTKNHQNRKITT